MSIEQEIINRKLEKAWGELKEEKYQFDRTKTNLKGKLDGVKILKDESTIKLSSDEQDLLDELDLIFAEEE